jgi:butyrate kinase
MLDLAINPGSTSTKIGLLHDNEELLLETLQHTQEDLAPYQHSIDEQIKFRLKTIEDFLAKNKLTLVDVTGVIAIGGIMKPCAAGVYEINDEILDDLRSDKYGWHVSSLGGLIAHEIAVKNGIKAYVADPVTAVEIDEVARVSGHPLVSRANRGHTLNQKAMSMRAAGQLGKPYSEVSLIVVHLGGGISVIAHKNGRMIDTCGGRGEGAFSMDRPGGLNSWGLVKLCFSGKYTREEVKSMIDNSGGVVAYLGTRNLLDVENMIKNGNENAELIFNALAYQIAKEIGAMATVLKGQVDAIVLTGGMSNSKALTEKISSSVSFIAPVFIYPGESEMQALAQYLRQVWTNTVELKTY